MPLLQFPSFQALSNAGVLSAWIVLPFSIPNMFVWTDIFYLCVHNVPIRNTCSAFLLDELVAKIVTAASPHLYLVTDLGNCDHWHYSAIQDTFLRNCKIKATKDLVTLTAVLNLCDI